MIGVILTETGRWAAGEAHYRRALGLADREDGMVLANLAWNLKLQGRLDEAASAYERALLVKPDNVRGIGGFAQVEAGRGRLDRAIAPAGRSACHLAGGSDAASAPRPDGPAGRQPGCGSRPAAGGAGEPAAGRAGRQGPGAGAEKPAGRRHRLCTRSASACSASATAQRYEPEEVQKQADRYKAWFTADKILPLPRAARTEGPCPIFLIGFPHSGTGLLEQMLSRVAHVAPADAFAPISGLTELIPQLTGTDQAYPDALAETLIGDSQSLPRDLRRRYLDRLRESGIAAGAAYVTDRGPDNHWHLGLMKLLFPEAPIIHVIRHPYDVLLGNFAYDRRLEANCGVSLATLARHYDFTMNLIKHFRGQLTLRYFPVRYEDMVSEPAATLRELLAFIGAGSLVPDEFSLRANEFLATPRIPGHVAVRQSIHGRNRYKYRAYEALMPNLFSEIRPLIEPWIAELGYGDAA